FGLYEGVRAFAEETLKASPDATATHERWLAYFTRLATSTLDPEVGERAFENDRRLSRDLENLVAARAAALQSVPTRARAIEATRIVLSLEHTLLRQAPARFVSLLDASLAALGVNVDPSLLARAWSARARAQVQLGALANAASTA